MTWNCVSCSFSNLDIVVDCAVCLLPKIRPTDEVIRPPDKVKKMRLYDVVEDVVEDVEEIDNVPTQTVSAQNLLLRSLAMEREKRRRH